MTFVSVEEKYPHVFRMFRVDAYAFPHRDVPDSVRLRYRRHAKGRMFVFEKYPVTSIEPLRTYALVLATTLYLEGEAVDVDPQVGIRIVGFERNPKKIKEKIPSWKPLRGRVRRGHKEIQIGWVIRLPTYRRRDVCFIASLEDVDPTLPEGDRLSALVEKYRHPTRNRVISEVNVHAQPLFRSDAEFLTKLIFPLPACNGSELTSRTLQR